MEQERTDRGRAFSILLTALVGLILLGGCAAIWARIRHGEPVRDLPFPRTSLDYFMLDDVCGHVHRPNVEKSYRWDEHPTGKIVARTNNFGFREDTPTNPDKAPGVLRVLVTGDSHIDGVVYNSESFPNVLEDLLRTRLGTRPVEVLNGGVGHFGPYNFPGFLRKNLFLHPDLYVVVLYTGNDYLDVVRDGVTRRRIEVPERPEGYLSRLERATKVDPGAVSQALNELYLFKTFPELREQAVALAAEQFHQVHALCAKNGIGLLVIALPTKIDVEYGTDSEKLGEAMKILGLNPNDSALEREMTQDLLGRVRGEGVATFDPLEALEKAPGPLYWREDHHLNVAGQRALAEAAFPVVVASLASVPAAVARAF